MKYEKELLEVIRSSKDKEALISFARQLCESLLLSQLEERMPSDHPSVS